MYESHSIYYCYVSYTGVFIFPLRRTTLPPRRTTIYMGRYYNYWKYPMKTHHPEKNYQLYGDNIIIGISSVYQLYNHLDRDTIFIKWRILFFQWHWESPTSPHHTIMKNHHVYPQEEIRFIWRYNNYWERSILHHHPTPWRITTPQPQELPTIWWYHNYCVIV